MGPWAELSTAKEMKQNQDDICLTWTNCQAPHRVCLHLVLTSGPCELDIQIHTFTQRNGHFRQSVSHAQGQMKNKRRDDGSDGSLNIYVSYVPRSGPDFGEK